MLEVEAVADSHAVEGACHKERVSDADSSRDAVVALPCLDDADLEEVVDGLEVAR